MLRHIVLVAALVAACTSSVPDPFDSILSVQADMCGRQMVASAVLIRPELVLTNAHNVAGSDGHLTLFDSDGGETTGTVVAIDIERDLALLHAPGVAGRVIDTDRPSEQGAGRILRLTPDLAPAHVDYHGADPIVVAGHDMYDAPSKLRRSSVRVIADVGPGWSGAPLVTADGRMVGLVYAESRSSGYTYAIAVDEIERFVHSAEARSALLDTGACAP